MSAQPTDEELIRAECAEVCTSGCHADDCEHHDHIPTAAAPMAINVEQLREAMKWSLVEHGAGDGTILAPSVEEVARRYNAALRAALARPAEEERG